jgi:PST family polysaccharide transporter
VTTPTSTDSKPSSPSVAPGPEPLETLAYSRGGWLTRTGWLVSGSAAQTAVSAGVGVVLARFLGPGNFGIYSALTVAIALVATLAGFRLQFHLVTVLQARRGDRILYVQVLKAAYLVTLPVCVAALAIALGALSGKLRLLAAIAVAEVAVYPLRMARVALQVHGRQFAMAIAGLTGRLAWAALVAAIVVAKPANALVFIMAARVVALAVEAALLAWMAHLPLVGWCRARVGGVRQSLQILRSSVPLAISGISGVGYDRIDQLLLGPLRGAVQTGLYASGVRVAELLGMLPPLVQNVSLPGLVELHRRQDSRGFDAAVADSLLLTLVPVGLGMAVLVPHGGPLAVLVFGHAYRGTGEIIAVLAVAEGLRLVGTTYSSAALAVGARGLWARATIAGFAINVVLNLALIPFYGGLAAAWASLVAYGVASGIKVVGHPSLRRSSFASGTVLVKVGAAVVLADSVAVVREVPLAASIALSCLIYVAACTALMPDQARRLARQAHRLSLGLARLTGRTAQS